MPAKSPKTDRFAALSASGHSTKTPLAAKALPGSRAESDDPVSMELRLYTAQREKAAELMAGLTASGRASVNKSRLFRAALMRVTLDPAFLTIYDEMTAHDLDRMRTNRVRS